MENGRESYERKKHATLCNEIDSMTFSYDEGGGDERNRGEKVSLSRSLAVDV